MLVLALTTRETGTSPCKYLGITNPKLIWELDIAIKHRLMVYDNEREIDKAKTQARLQSLAMLAANAGEVLELNTDENKYAEAP